MGSLANRITIVVATLVDRRAATLDILVNKKQQSFRMTVLIESNIYGGGDYTSNCSRGNSYR